MTELPRTAAPARPSGPSRRKVLSLIGGGTVLAATAGAATFLGSRTPHAALAPWAAAGTPSEPRLRALSYALLAPNPHNRQPWEAELIGPDVVAIWRDPARDLPMTDPFGRQLTIGMGCFLELMVLAAAETGHGVELDLYPEGEAGPVALARFRAGEGTPDPLFAAVMDRRSCKEPFADLPVPAADAAALSAHAAVHTDAATVAALKALTWEAWVIEMETPRTWKESVDLLRIGKAEIEASPDGIDLGGAMFDLLKPLGLVSRAAMLNPDDIGVRQTREMYRRMLAATPAHVSITTAGNTRADQIAVGRAWLRLNLDATARGLALQPVSQALQEFPEMAGPRATAHALLAPNGGTVQMLGRLGYGPDVAQTPRWPLETRLRHARG